MNGTADSAPVRVLVVEDNDDQRALLEAILGRAGCEVHGVATAEEAIEDLASTPPELAIVDLLLPGFDGWALARRIRDGQPSCPVAVASVLDERRFPEGAFGLPKPFTRDQVLSVLKRAVPRWEGRRR